MTGAGAEPGSTICTSRSASSSTVVVALVDERRRAAGLRATPGRGRGCASVRPTTTRRRRRVVSSIVTDAAFCISERNRATSSPATSQRRRSVRSRTLSTRSSPSGAPIISTRRQPSALRTRSSSSVPTSLACTLVSASAASWRSSGWMKSRPLRADRLRRPGCRTAARRRGWPTGRRACGSIDEHGVGQARVATAASAVSSGT